jgi:hypothetical protein
MRKRFLGGLWTAGLLAGLGVFALPTEAAEITFKVPFEFMVNGAALPRGDYAAYTAHSALFVQGLNQGAIVLTIGLESKTDGDAKLVFDKYGDQYVLRQVWMGGGSGRQLPKPRLDRELAEAGGGEAGTGVERVVIPAS